VIWAWRWLTASGPRSTQLGLGMSHDLSFSLFKAIKIESVLNYVKIEHYCALEGLIVLLILMFEVAVLCRRVPATCQAVVLTCHLTSSFQPPSNAMTLTNYTTIVLGVNILCCLDVEFLWVMARGLADQCSVSCRTWPMYAADQNRDCFLPVAQHRRDARWNVPISSALSTRATGMLGSFQF